MGKFLREELKSAVREAALEALEVGIRVGQIEDIDREVLKSGRRRGRWNQNFAAHTNIRSGAVPHRRTMVHFGPSGHRN